MPAKVAKGRCGYNLQREIFSNLPESEPHLRNAWYLSHQAVCCWRESWEDSIDGRCIWHADTDQKPIDELIESRIDQPERLGGAILRGLNLDDRIDFSNCVLNRADLAEANLYKSILCEASLYGADLTNADISSANPKGADLTEADLSNASLGFADLTNAELRDATVEGADLGSADLTGISIWYTSLDEFEINEWTVFRGKAQMERSADESAEQSIPFVPWSLSPLRALGRPFTDPFPLQQAELQYRATQRIIEENDFRRLPELDVREKHVRRKRMLAEWHPNGFSDNFHSWVTKPINWIKLAGSRWTTLYGESPWRVVYTSLAVIVGFAILYPTAVLESTSLLDRLYFSVTTFTPLTGNSVPPEYPTARVLAMIETLLGITLTALLVAVLDRRITR